MHSFYNYNFTKDILHVSGHENPSAGCKIQAYGTCHYGESVCRYTAVKNNLMVRKMYLVGLEF